jgi:hypothetical protein
MEDLQGNWKRISPDWIGAKGEGWGLGELRIKKNLGR